MPQAEGRARPRVPRHADRSHQEPGPERVRGHRAPAALQAAGRWVEARARAPLHDRAGLQNPLWPLHWSNQTVRRLTCVVGSCSFCRRGRRNGAGHGRASAPFTSPRLGRWASAGVWGLGDLRRRFSQPLDPVCSIWSVLYHAPSVHAVFNLWNL